MSRKILVLDRVVVLLLGVDLVVLGLLAIDWRGRYVLDGYTDTLGTQRAQDVVDSGWWPWVFAVAGVVVALVGLSWLLGHVTRGGPSTARISSSDQTGRIEADLRSVASAVASELDRTAPVVDPRGSTDLVSGVSVVQVEARVDPYADAASLIQAVEASAREVEAAFPDDRVELRVVLGSPRKPKRERTGTVRVSG